MTFSRIAFVTGLLAFLVHASSLGNGFVNWDDDLYVTANPFIRQLDGNLLRQAFLGSHASNWHPLTWLSHGLDHALWGLRPAGHHLTSILLHAVNTALVFLLAVKLFQAGGTGGGATADDGRSAREAAFLAALVFGLHPLRVESVAWVAERKDVLSAFFVLLALLAYLRAVERPSAVPLPLLGRQGGPLLLFLCAVMSKPMAVTLPVVLLLLDRYPLDRFRREGSRPVLAEKLPFLAIGLFGAAAAIAAQHAAGSITPVAELPLAWRLLISAAAPAQYLFKTLLPAGLSPFYPLPDVEAGYRAAVPLLLPAGVTIGVTVWLLVKHGTHAPMGTAWFSFLVMLAPVSGIIHVGDAMLADRYTYLPLIGPVIVAAAVVQHAIERLAAGRAAFAGTILLLTVILSLLTVMQTAVWRSGETLWSRVIKRFPGEARAYSGRGSYLLQQGAFGRAVQDLERALALRPDAPAGVFANLSWAYLNLGRTGDALVAADRAVLRDGQDYYARLYRGIVRLELGQLEAAEEDFRGAILLSPDRREPYQNLGAVLAAMERFPEAEESFRKALAVDPSYLRPRLSLGDLYLRRSMPDRAAAEFSAVLGASPGHPAALNGLGEALLAQGRTTEASGLFEQALTTDPAMERARRNLLRLRRLN